MMLLSPVTVEDLLWKIEFQTAPVTKWSMNQQKIPWQKLFWKLSLSTIPLFLIQDNVHYDQNTEWSIHSTILLQITFTNQYQEPN